MAEVGGLAPSQPAPRLLRDPLLPRPLSGATLRSLRQCLATWRGEKPARARRTAHGLRAGAISAPPSALPSRPYASTSEGEQAAVEALNGIVGGG
jgi:hypothetical protein